MFVKSFIASNHKIVLNEFSEISDFDDARLHQSSRSFNCLQKRCIKIFLLFRYLQKTFAWSSILLFYQLLAKNFRWFIKFQHETFRRRHFKLIFIILIDQEIAVLAYQINEFIFIDHKYKQFILDSVKNAAAAIIIESNIKTLSVESNDRSRTYN